MRGKPRAKIEFNARDVVHLPSMKGEKVLLRGLTGTTVYVVTQSPDGDREVNVVTVPDWFNVTVEVA